MMRLIVLPKKEEAEQCTVTKFRELHLISVRQGLFVDNYPTHHKNQNILVSMGKFIVMKVIKCFLRIQKIHTCPDS